MRERGQGIGLPAQKHMLLKIAAARQTAAAVVDDQS